MRARVGGASTRGIRIGIPLQKVFGFWIFELPPRARSARRRPESMGFRRADENEFPENGFISTIVTLYYRARTYFAQHPTQ